MILVGKRKIMNGIRLPRMRGDDPDNGLIGSLFTGFTPHARG